MHQRSTATDGIQKTYFKKDSEITTVFAKRITPLFTCPPVGHPGSNFPVSKPRPEEGLKINDFSDVSPSHSRPTSKRGPYTPNPGIARNFQTEGTPHAQLASPKWTFMGRGAGHVGQAWASTWFAGLRLEPRYIPIIQRGDEAHACIVLQRHAATLGGFVQHRACLIVGFLVPPSWIPRIAPRLTLCGTAGPDREI